jgi:hypothetical protein
VLRQRKGQGVGGYNLTEVIDPPSRVRQVALIEPHVLGEDACSELNPAPAITESVLGPVIDGNSG